MRHAFSLIEVIIAISLGMVILVTIYAGFRVASQSITITERLALENKLLIGGMVSALDELDRWTAFDRPGHQPLRPGGPFKPISPSAGGYADNGSDWSSLPQPFTPFNAASGGAASWSASGAAQPYSSRWLVNDPATWYRGDGALAYQSGAFRTDLSPWGNYALFSNAAANVQVSPEGGGDVPVNERWLPSQHKGLKYGLGFYGWYSYLPANTFIDYYDVHDGSSRGIRPIELRDLLGHTPNQPTMHQIGQVGRLRLQIGTGSGLLQTGSERAATRPFSLYTNHLGISAYPPGAAADEQRHRVMINRQMGGAYGGESVSTYPVLQSSLAVVRPLIAAHPAHWPEVSFDVRRTMKWSMVVNLCTVRVEDPVSGRMSEVSFTATGTTLRGARMSRGLDL